MEVHAGVLVSGLRRKGRNEIVIGGRSSRGVPGPSENFGIGSISGLYDVIPPFFIPLFLIRRIDPVNGHSFEVPSGCVQVI